MFTTKEKIIYSLINLGILILAMIFGVVLKVDILYMLVVTGVIIIAYVSGLIIIEGLYKRIHKLRLHTEDYNCNTIERFDEDEIGRLAMSIAEMINKFKESENKQLKEKEFLKDIISDISHQIKTPVASLTVFNDLLLQAVTEEHLHNMLIQSEEQLERIKWLIQAMLQLARIEASSVKFDMKDIDGRVLCQSCIAFIKQKAIEKNITINLAGEGRLYVDGEWLQEALVNIIKNSIDYSPANTNIDICISSTPISNKITITDQGPGILEKDRLNIFKRFFRSNNNSVNPSSVGIGLSLAKSIIEGMNGKIWVESRHISECVGDENSYTTMHIMF